jgi:pyrroline-5-carboxylate reductase
MDEIRDKNIAVVGAGNMGGALIAGLVQSGTLPPERVTAVDIDAALLDEHRQTLGVNTSRDAAAVAAEQDVVVLGLKPQVWASVVAPLVPSLTGRQMVLSIMGGVRTEAIEEVLGGRVPVVRAMPNILAQIRASVAAICPGRFTQEAHMAAAEAILQTVGESVRLSEAQMDAVTGLSGSGPAFVYLIIDALADGGVKMGIPKPVALKLAAHTVFGSAKMVIQSGQHPAVLKDQVTSAGGTTIAGLQALEQGGIRAALMKAVEAATRRSEELGA